MKKRALTVYLTENQIKGIENICKNWDAPKSEVIAHAVQKLLLGEEHEIIQKIDTLIETQNRNHHYNFLGIEIVGLLALSIFQNEEEAGNNKKEKLVYANNKINNVIKILEKINSKEEKGFMAKFYDHLHIIKKRKELK